MLIAQSSGFSPPTLGTRSWGPLNAAIDTVEVEKLNTEVTALAMIETKDGLDNLEEICAVRLHPPPAPSGSYAPASAPAYALWRTPPPPPLRQVRGIDGIFVGPYDLSLSLGLSPDPSAQTQIMQDALEHIRHVAKSAGVVAGIHCRDSALLSRMMKLEYNFCTLATDMEYATQGLQAMVATAVHMKSTQPVHDVTSSLLALHNIEADQQDTARELEAAAMAVMNAEPRLTVSDQMKMAPEWDHAHVLAMGTDLPSDDLVDKEPSPPPTEEELERLDAARERLRKLKSDPESWKAECIAWNEAMELAEARLGSYK